MMLLMIFLVNNSIKPQIFPQNSPLRTYVEKVEKLWKFIYYFLHLLLLLLYYNSYDYMGSVWTEKRYFFSNLQLLLHHHWLPTVSINGIETSKSKLQNTTQYNNNMKTGNFYWLYCIRDYARMEVSSKSNLVRLSYVGKKYCFCIFVSFVVFFSIRLHVHEYRQLQLECDDSNGYVIHLETRDDLTFHRNKPIHDMLNFFFLGISLEKTLEQRKGFYKKSKSLISFPCIILVVIALSITSPADRYPYH